MAETMRRRLEKAEDARLAPYALRSASARRRYPAEDEGRVFDYRTQFQRDRDRIVYSRAFRRLRQKAQAGILPDYEDHRRNRLTHTLEVTQFARTMGRALDLNEDLIESVALGHDLGHPAFGATGERTLDDLTAGRLDGRGGSGLGDIGGFWRAWQGLRVVDGIEKRYDHPGLNLTDPVREDIFKCDGGIRPPPDRPESIRVGLQPLFEIQVVALADRISGALSDLDDALQSGVVDVARVERLLAVTALRKKLGPAYRARAGRFVKANMVHRGVIHLMVTAAVLHSARRLGRWAARHKVRRPEDFRAVADHAVEGNEIDLSPTGRGMLQDIEGFLEAHVHRRFEADREDARGRRVLLGLFAAYHVDPTLLDDYVLLRYKEVAGVRFLRDLRRGEIEQEVAQRYHPDPRFVRLLVDHLSAMTDAYALAEHARLLEMGAVPIPGVEQLKRESRPG